MAELTPLMKQYWEIKSQHQDKVLLFRMGDFYEMFHEDAKIAAPILNIALTSRNKKSEDDTPMCGVPHHSIATPIGKLLAAGYKVAICDQLENPEDAKGIVKRGVTRILSPGMVYDPDDLKESKSNYVAAVDLEHVSFLEASTGECFYFEVDQEAERREILNRYQPVEILWTTEQKKHLSVWGAGTGLNGMATGFSAGLQAGATSSISTIFDACETSWPDRFAKIPESAARLLTYATHMQGVAILSLLGRFERRRLSASIHFGANVLKHLEIFQNYRGEEDGTLFQAVNRTKTSAGARLLKAWLKAPLTTQTKIEERMNQVESWTQKPSDLKILRQTLAQMGDVERRLVKISYNNCQVRDLSALMQSLQVGLAITPLCEDVAIKDKSITAEVADRIEQIIVEDPPLTLKLGGAVRKGYNSTLDELIELSENAQSLLLELENRERAATQISSLKIRYNNVFGYYIEVTNTHKDRVPDHYKRKQTLANAERYVTQELHELEGKILASRDKRVQLEEQIFQELREFVLKRGSVLLAMAAKWSELDVLASLAWLAIEQRYVRPQFHENMSLQIRSSRHPVVEQGLTRNFVPNDVSLGAGDCMLLTGPNMAGKSTLMRQIALTVVMAQMGSFVPAQSASLPIFEKIFTRIGASDSLSEGLSTFMVEMKETSELLRDADSHSLVLLDEIGRGTSTYDGMSLAQSILEYLNKSVRSLTFFATHYHEITALSDLMPRVRNFHMSIREEQGEIHFHYALNEGPANKSYGIQVARLAGLPEVVIKRAQTLLRLHEERTGGPARDLPLLTYSQIHNDGVDAN